MVQLPEKAEESSAITRNMSALLCIRHKKLYYEDYDYTYYDYISVNMDRYRDENVRTRAVRLVDNRNMGRKNS